MGVIRVELVDVLRSIIVSIGFRRPVQPLLKRVLASNLLSRNILTPS